MGNERTFSREVGRSFDLVGWYAEKRVDTKGVTPSGRPDYTVYDTTQSIGLTGRHFWIEVKYGLENNRTGFNFARISEDQRKWLSYGPKLKGRDESGLYNVNWVFKCWLWLFMGRNVASKDYPRAAYLIPWVDWLDVERQFTSQGLKGMAYIMPKQLAHRALGLSAQIKLAEYRLEWLGKNVWGFPDRHQIWRTLE